jgi:hypothetical protein
MNPPAALPAQRSAFVRIDIAAIGGAHPAWSVPVQAYFKRADNGWTRIALERQSQQ